MGRIANAVVWVEMDDRWPRPVWLGRVDGGEMAGCEPGVPFALEINGRRVGAEQIEVTARFAADRAEYDLGIESLGLRLRLSYVLEGQELVLRIPEVTESGELRVDRIDFPGLWLVAGQAAPDGGGDWFLRHITRRMNWSRHWCPGTATYDQWEDMGRVGDAFPELGGQYSNHACVWNPGICVGVASSVRVEPLVSELSRDGQVLEDRSGQCRIRPGRWAYRLRGTPAEPLVVRIGILGDYDGDGSVDWTDAAAWEGDLSFTPDPRYHEAVIYKLFMDDPKAAAPYYRYADCLKVVEMLHRITGGHKQIVYLVGWQHTGHDTGYPCHDQLNPRLGTREGLVQLIEAARAFNCIVSLHANFDDSMAEYPEFDAKLLSRDPNGAKAWFFNHLTGYSVLSVSHTLANESGYNADRLARLLKLLPIRETIHFDAHRPYNEVWLEDGTHIGAECEVQRGLVPLQRMLREQGIDLTTEDADAEKRGLYAWTWIQPNWLHPYSVAMCHGRLPGLWRAGMPRGSEATRIEGLALGMSMTKMESPVDQYEDVVRCFYLHWMYAEVLRRKKMTGYWVGDWSNGIRAWYESGTYVEAGGSARELRAVYEGIEIARGTDRFLPWREDVIYAYSQHGGPQSWVLPAGWRGRAVTCHAVDHTEQNGTPITVQDDRVQWEAVAGVPYRLTVSPRP